MAPLGCITKNMIQTATLHLQETCEGFSEESKLFKERNDQLYEEFFQAFLSKYIDALDLKRDIKEEIYSANSRQKSERGCRVELEMKVAHEMIEALWNQRQNFPKRIFRVEANASELSSTQNQLEKLLSTQNKVNDPDACQQRHTFFSHLRSGLLASLLKRFLRSFCSPCLILTSVVSSLMLEVVSQYLFPNKQDHLLHSELFDVSSASEPSSSTNMSQENVDDVSVLTQLRRAKMEVALTLLVMCLPQKNRLLLQSLMHLLRYIRDQSHLEMDSISLSRMMNQCLFPFPNHKDATKFLPSFTSHQTHLLVNRDGISIHPQTCHSNILHSLAVNTEAVKSLLGMEERLFQIPLVLSNAWDTKVKEIDTELLEYDNEIHLEDNHKMSASSKTRDPSPFKFFKLISGSIHKLCSPITGSSQDGYKVQNVVKDSINSGRNQSRVSMSDYPVIKSRSKDMKRHQRSSSQDSAPQRRLDDPSPNKSMKSDMYKSMGSLVSRKQKRPFDKSYGNVKTNPSPKKVMLSPRLWLNRLKKTSSNDNVSYGTIGSAESCILQKVRKDSDNDVPIIQSKSINISLMSTKSDFQTAGHNLSVLSSSASCHLTNASGKTVQLNGFFLLPDMPYP